MKTTLFTSIVAIAGMLGQCAAAQTNDTYPVLRTLDGTAYTNAEVASVTATHLTVFFNGGGARIAFTNLSPELKKKYHFDPAIAAAAAGEEAAKRSHSMQELQEQQAQAQKRLNWRGDTVKAHVLSINTIYEFKVSVKGIEQTVTFFKMPKDVTDFIERMNSIRNSLDNLTAANQSQRQYAAGQRAIANAMEHYRDDGSLNPNYPAQQAEANLAEARAEEQRTQIAELTVELAKRRLDEVKKTTILARPTGKFYAHQVWEFVGMPSDDNMDMNAPRRNEGGH